MKTDAGAFWESRYADKGQVWSGKVNALLQEVAWGLSVGSVLDLGCGEGGDVLWFASLGWRATGVDIAPSAIERASAEAQRLGFAEDQTRFLVMDLSREGLEESFDLVTASFFHSPVELDRGAILRRAASLVAPGGHLLLLSHVAPPPWAHALAESGKTPQQSGFLSPSEEVALLGLHPPKWEVKLAELRDRTAKGPNNEEAVLTDRVVLAKRG